jgi:hypothetical protein
MEHVAWITGTLEFHTPSLGIAGSNPAGGMDISLVSVVCYQVEVCVGLITRPEAYRVWCLWVWSWSLDIEEALAQ